MNIFKGIVCWFMTFILIISCNVYEPDYDNIVYDENGNNIMWILITKTYHCM